MKRKTSLRRILHLAAVSVVVSVVLAIGLGELQYWWFDSYRIRLGDQDAEAARRWRPTSDFFEPRQMVLRQPVVRDFELVDVSEASEHITNPEMVIGVTVNGEARAYPVNVMTGPKRQIFNDELGGRLIAATW